MESNSTTVYKIIEDKASPDVSHANSNHETDIQVAYLNMLHEQGLLTDNIHSIAINKAIKGVV